MNAFAKTIAVLAASAALISVSACKKEEAVSDNANVAVDAAAGAADAAPAADAAAGAAEAAPAVADNSDALDQLTRDEFNRAALRLNVPLFWKYEETPNKQVRPEVIDGLNFYPDSDKLVWKDKDGKFTPAFKDIYGKMVKVLKDPTMGETLSDDEKTRRNNIAAELDQSAVTVVSTDFSDSDENEKAFVRAMLKVGAHIDAIYASQVGLDDALTRIPAEDVMARSMARRNWGVAPVSPKMANVPNARAIAGDVRIPIGVYPEDVQKEKDFCAILEGNAYAEEILTPFTAVIKEGDLLKAVPYSEYYKTNMVAVSNALKEAAKALESNKDEEALRKYLLAASQSFLDNNWEPADEAWAAMNSTNSKWYVRVAPDEVYWEPCSRKAGFHQTFARINPEALAWQEKLSPVQQEMEERIAAVAGAPYKARTVSFHLPDFIDIVTNSGDDRDAFGATIGQSLPNWGPVANEGRGRTVAMSNLYTDPDSLRDRKTLASAMFTEADIAYLLDATGPGLLGTIIHEACHNLGPAHEYTVNGKKDDEIFTGELASMAEEFKAQTGALWFLQMLVEKEIISQELANKSYADSVYWAFGHISRGLKDGEGHIKPYSQLAAIQLGMMMEDGAVSYDPEAAAANGSDKGAFIIHMDKMPASVDRIMKAITKIKAKGDKDGLIELQTKYAYGDIIPFNVIQDRMLRLPKTSFVYSVKLDK